MEQKTYKELEKMDNEGIAHFHFCFGATWEMLRLTDEFKELQKKIDDPDSPYLGFAEDFNPDDYFSFYVDNKFRVTAKRKELYYKELYYNDIKKD